MKRITQRDSILRYMQSHKTGITSKIAFERFGCTRLSAVIWALKHKGYKIIAKDEKVKGRYGNVSITRYMMGE